MMGPLMAPNFDMMAQYVGRPELKPIIQGFSDAVLANPASFLFRAAVAMDVTKTPYNHDEFNGFAYERAALIDGLVEKANNPIVLGGDSHDSWAWTLYKGGKMDGEPAAVNLGCPGVTSPGWGSFVLADLLKPLEGVLGGVQGTMELIANTTVGRNKGLVYADVINKGFVAVKATKVSNHDDAISS